MKALDATPITPVPAQPSTVHTPEILNWPMTLERVVSSISSTMTGTATIPFKTADHTNALTGFSSNTLAAAPSSVARAMAP
jgi:hypothetical protein